MYAAAARVEDRCGAGRMGDPLRAAGMMRLALTINAAAAKDCAWIEYDWARRCLSGAWYARAFASGGSACLASGQPEATIRQAAWHKAWHGATRRAWYAGSPIEIR